MSDQPFNVGDKVVNDGTWIGKKGEVVTVDSIWQHEDGFWYVRIAEYMMRKPSHNVGANRLKLYKPQREPADSLYSYVADKLGKSRSDAKRDVFMHAYGKTNPQLAALQHDPKLDQLLSETKAKLARTIQADAIRTGILTTRLPNLQNIPKEQPVNKTAAELQVELDTAIKAEAAAVAAQTKAEELNRMILLAGTTRSLLVAIRDGAAPTAAALADFRKELQPLANSLGYRIVLVGDRTQATLVQA